MNIFKLVNKEILRRKTNYLFGFTTVAIAVAIITGSLSLLKVHDIQTAAIVETKEEEVMQRVRKMQDDYRKITLELGFNLLIIPEGQNLGNFYADDFASKYMPETATDKLAESRHLTIQHLLPSLTRKIVWTEYKQSIILIGTKGEVPYLYRNPKKPMLQPVPEGGIMLGYELHRILNLHIGDKIKLLGREFTVYKCNERRGSKDDATVWIPLKDAQELLNKPGLINAILALKCHCAGNSLSKILTEVKKILPNVQILQKNKEVAIRAKARDRAKKEAKEAVAAEALARKQLKEEQLRFTEVIVPLVLIVGGVMISLTFLANVKARRDEIGILRTIGVKQHSILQVFLLKAIHMSIPGAIVGYLAGIYTAIFHASGAASWSTLSSAKTLAMTIGAALLASIISSWLPAFYASQQDPAEIMREN